MAHSKEVSRSIVIVGMCILENMRTFVFLTDTASIPLTPYHNCNDNLYMK